MKRLWIAVFLLLIAVGVCVLSQWYLHRQTSVLLSLLTDLEDSYRAGELDTAAVLAAQVADEYPRYLGLAECFVAHSDLEDSRETAALLPSVLEQDHREELLMEIARLREQLEHLQGIDRLTWRNVL
ncbi:MAG: DUF4363 family protein [Clostridia bacterium]|nr:DUF4363 family protein [Clostridia bacterium]